MTEECGGAVDWPIGFVHLFRRPFKKSEMRLKLADTIGFKRWCNLNPKESLNYKKVQV